MADQNDEKGAVMAKIRDRYERAWPWLDGMHRRLVFMENYNKGDTFSSPESFNEFLKKAREALEYAEKNASPLLDGSIGRR